MSAATVNIGSVIMPAGKYYVGDPCYACPDERWLEWLKAANFEDEGRYLAATLDGHALLGIGTMYGDGSYLGSDGKDYPVDAGLLGLVPVEVADITGYKDMEIVEFPDDFTCTWDDSGVITLGHIEIDTNPDDPDESDSWYS